LFWKVNFRNKIRFIEYSILSIIIFVIFVQIAYPQWLGHMVFLMSSALGISTGGSQSGIVRWLEVKNIWANLANKYSFLQGVGLGVYWEVIYPFPEDPLHFIFPAGDPSGMHHFSHLLFMDLLWKFGFIGLIVYLYLLYSLFKKGFLLFDRLHDKYYKGIIMGLLSTIFPVLFLLGYYKLYLFAGVLIGMIAVLVRLKGADEIV